LLDLLSAVMNSRRIWTEAAGDPQAGQEWRDAVTKRLIAARAYVPYEAEVVAATADVDLPPSAATELLERWHEMEPWPDSAALSRLTLPYGFVTNCSQALAQVAARRSRLSPELVLSAEEAGWYKPDARIYREACARVGRPPESTLFVAGSGYDAEGARAAGLQSVLVPRRPDDRAFHPKASLEDVVGGIATDGSSPC
jgi:2-haloacid dehalogenase